MIQMCGAHLLHAKQKMRACKKRRSKGDSGIRASQLHPV